MKPALVAVLVLFLVGGCCCMFPSGDPYAGVYTKTEPDAKNLVGTWAVTEASLRWLKDQGYDLAPGPKLELRGDGTFKMQNMPDCWWFAPQWAGAKVLDSGSGKWSVARHQRWWCLRMDFDTVNGNQEHRTADFMLRAQAPPYTIHVTVGDPDGGQCIELEQGGHGPPKEDAWAPPPISI